MKPRVLLAWEAGGGRGHIMTLRALASALGDQFVYDAALCRMDHAMALEGLCDRVFPASYLYALKAQTEARGDIRVATWADFLGDIGFARPDFLIRQIQWWIGVITARRSRLVLCEFAPCAMLAARVLGVPAVSVGTGYGTPPAGMDAFPVLLAEHARLVHAESDLLDNVNAALAHFSHAPLARFADIYACDGQLSSTIAALDPYADYRPAPAYLPLFDAGFPDVLGGGDEIFCYFSTDEHLDPVLIDAIASLGLPTRLVMAQASDAQRDYLGRQGVIVETGALTHTAIAARSRIMVHAGQHGSLCLGLGLGLPQVAVPRLLEQAFHVRRAAAFGTVSEVSRHERDSDVIRQAIVTVYHDAGRRCRAQQVAADLRSQLVGDLRALVQGHIAPILAA